MEIPFAEFSIIQFERRGIRQIMTSVLAIAAEYNPFHKGHQYQIEEARKKTNCDVVMAVMSGNWVQRGEPAILDQFARAEAAVRGGVDLVAELPYIYATQSATGFAHGAVSVMKAADVNYISFGSECGNLENLKEIAETPVNPDHLHQSMDTGMSFPRAYSLLTTSMRPNDILAVSYLKEIAGTAIEPVLIPRTTSYLDPELHETSSALAIRTALKEGKDLGETTPMKEALLNGHRVYMEQFYPYLRTFLLTSRPERLAEFFLFREGIENHLIANAKKESTWDGFLSACVNYRYTAGRIRRTCLSAMMQLEKKEVNSLPPYDTIRVLAFNDRGRQYLHDMRKSGVRFASRFADVPYPYREMEYRACLLYTSVLPEKERTRILREEIAGAHYVK